MLVDTFHFKLIPRGYHGSVAVRPATREEARGILLAAGSGIIKGSVAAAISADLGVYCGRGDHPGAYFPEDQFVIATFKRPSHGDPSIPPEGRVDYQLVTIGHPEKWESLEPKKD